MLTDWHPLGSVLYRKWQVYDMEWGDSMRLEKCRVCGAPFGGPIAIIADECGDAEPESSEPAFVLSIYTSSGRRISKRPLDSNFKNVIGMGWTDKEHLLICSRDGQCRMYDIHCRVICRFSLRSSSYIPSSRAGGEFTITECHFWGNGVVALSADLQICVAEGTADTDIARQPPRVYVLQTGVGYDRTISALGLIPPLVSSSGLLEVLVGTSDHSILVVYEGDREGENVAQDQLLQTKLAAAVSKIVVAPNGRFLACFCQDGVLTVMSSSFSTKVLDFDTKSVSAPIEIAWCGADSVVMQWRNTGVAIVGPYGNWLNFPYDVAAHLVPEIDCCRIITSINCEILQRVPACTEAIASVGSTDPAALMFDAMEAFEEGDPKSDENIRSLAAADQLHDAVSSCIAAAAAEFDLDRQESFLKAASYGKAFCPPLANLATSAVAAALASTSSSSYSASPPSGGGAAVTAVDPREFVETARKLRVLNTVRAPSVGIPLTIDQFNRLSPEVLVSRLTARHMHFLALRVCEYLKLNNERVLVHWACEKIRRMAGVGSSSSGMGQVEGVDWNEGYQDENGNDPGGDSGNGETTGNPFASEKETSLSGNPFALSPANSTKTDKFVGKVAGNGWGKGAVLGGGGSKVGRAVGFGSGETATGGSGSGATDDEICERVRKQLEPYGRLSYLTIAETAYQINRRKLATRLLEYEQNPTDQIPLLLKMGEEALALEKAVKCEDADLVYYTLLSLEANVDYTSRESVEAFFHTIVYKSPPEALNLLKLYYRSRVTSTDRSLLHNLLSYSRNFYDAGVAATRQAYQQSALSDQIQCLKEASYLFAQGASGGSGVGGAGGGGLVGGSGSSATSGALSLSGVGAGFVGSSSSGSSTSSSGGGGIAAGAGTAVIVVKENNAFYKSMTDEQIELLDIQKTLERRCDPARPRPFLNLTVAETLRQLLEMGLAESADSQWTNSEVGKLVKRFKVNEKVLWYTKIDCIARSERWDLLHKFANERRSPIGYKPFAVLCIKHSRPEYETEKYVEKVSDAEDKFELYVSMKAWKKAVDVAIKLKDPYRLQEVRRGCQDPELQRYIQELVSSM